jgi:hypothetical protein
MASISRQTAAMISTAATSLAMTVADLPLGLRIRQ